MTAWPKAKTEAELVWCGSRWGISPAPTLIRRVPPYFGGRTAAGALGDRVGGGADLVAELRYPLRRNLTGKAEDGHAKHRTGLVVEDRGADADQRRGQDEAVGGAVLGRQLAEPAQPEEEE